MSISVRSQYFPQLDGIRTLAVLMVIVSHWYRGEDFLFLYYGGAMGVGLFFVLSGFLISHILLEQQEAFLSGNRDEKIRILKTFYIRRTLRIFPIYYLYIGLILAIGLGQSREVWGWLLTYTYNIQLFLTNRWHSGFIEHLWSLAIEEQYYLIWPALLLFCPPRHHFRLVIGFILMGIICKASFYLHDLTFLHIRDSQYSKFPVSQFDGFGMGSLLALFMRRGITIPYAGLGFVVFWSISFFIKWSPVHFHGMSFLGQVLPFYFVGCACLIYLAAVGMNGIPGWLFGNSIVVFLGKISYGLYLYHLAVPALGNWLISRSEFFKSVFRKTYEFSLQYPEISFLQTGIPAVIIWIFYSLLLLGLTSISWYLIEQPINKLKKLFTY